MRPEGLTAFNASLQKAFATFEGTMTPRALRPIIAAAQHAAAAQAEAPLAGHWMTSGGNA